MVEAEMDGSVKINSRDFKKKMKSRKKKLLKKYEEKGTAAEVAAYSDTYQYLVRMTDVIENMRNDNYEMEVLANNVFNEVKENELYFAKIRITSKLFEDLLPYARDNDFIQFISPFIDNLRPVFTDRVASHILQIILEELLKRFVRNSSEDEKSSTQFSDTLLKISVFALNNAESFIWESSSNYVIRTVLNVLSGFNSKGEILQDVNIGILPSEFDSTLEKFAQTVINSPQFNEYFDKALTSGLIQTLIFSTKHLENVRKRLVKKIIKYCKFNSPDLKDELNEPILRIIEAVLQVADEKQYGKIFKNCFKNDLKELSVSKTANFAIQKLLKSCTNKEQFVMIFNELLPFGKNIFETGNTGVLLELAQGCVRHKSNQGSYVKMLMSVLKCKKTMNEDSDIAPLACCMITSDNFNSEEMKTNLHGTLIIQAILNFGKPIKVINSLLNMDISSLLQLICDSKGSHIIDAFLTSPYVGEKSRERLFKKLTGNFTKLATSKYGSRALDAIWNAVSTKNRVILMEELKKNESELTSNQFGRIFSYKTHLNIFRKNKDDWIKRERTMETTKRCFSDIIPAKKGKFTE